MTTLISYVSSSGEQGRCDAKCYDAAEPRCSCICGGANHGVGLNQAINNVVDQSEIWLEQYRLDHPGEEIGIGIPPWLQYELPRLETEVARTCPTS